MSCIDDHNTSIFSSRRASHIAHAKHRVYLDLASPQRLCDAGLCICTVGPHETYCWGPVAGTSTGCQSAKSAHLFAAHACRVLSIHSLLWFRLLLRVIRRLQHVNQSAARWALDPLDGPAKRYACRHPSEAYHSASVTGLAPKSLARERLHTLFSPDPQQGESLESFLSWIT